MTLHTNLRFELNDLCFQFCNVAILNKNKKRAQIHKHQNVSGKSYW